MTKVKTVLPWILLALTVFFPMGKLICAVYGYTFEISSVDVFTAVTAGVAVATVVVFQSFGTVIESMATKIMLLIITPLSLVCAAFYLIESFSWFVVISSCVTSVCCFILALKQGRAVVLIAISLALSAAIALPLVWVGFIMFAVDDFGTTTVVKTIESPNGEYYAEVINNDQGALGGATPVWVYDNGRVDLFLFKISKKPRRVYLGRCGEYSGMDIYWKDDRCLVINSVEYAIDE